jgi:hypothetical protein
VKFRIAWLSIALLAAPSLAPAQDDFVVPSSNASTEGDSSNTIPFSSAGGNVRYQQVYLDEDIPSGPFTIYGIAFRPDELQGSFAFEIPEIDIFLGPTAQGTSLNPEFALNVGDPTLVASGPLHLSSAASGPVGGPLSFDIEIWFDQPLAYDGGNLLLDIAIQPYTTSSIVLFDAVNLAPDAVARVFSAAASGGSVTSTSGNADTQGLVTKFLLPEPEGSAAAALAALAVLVRSRRNASRRRSRSMRPA